MRKRRLIEICAIVVLLVGILGKVCVGITRLLVEQSKGCCFAFDIHYLSSFSFCLPN